MKTPVIGFLTFMFFLLEFLCTPPGLVADNRDEEEDDYSDGVEEPSTDSDVQDEVAYIDVKIWESQTVPYVLCTECDVMQLIEIVSAMDEIQDKTCIKFIQQTNQTNYIRFKRASSTGECECESVSDVGRTGGKQIVNLTEKCFDRKSILHELAHALGLNDEHKRPDRDDFIKILWANVDQSGKSKFKKMNSSRLMDYKLPYDYKSVMHVKVDAYSKEGAKTIGPKNGQRIIKSNGLSDLDVLKINLLYNCTGLVPNDSIL